MHTNERTNIEIMFDEIVNRNVDLTEENLAYFAKFNMRKGLGVGKYIAMVCLIKAVNPDFLKTNKSRQKEIMMDLCDTNILKAKRKKAIFLCMMQFRKKKVSAIKNIDWIIRELESERFRRPELIKVR